MNFCFFFNFDKLYVCILDLYKQGNVINNVREELELLFIKKNYIRYQLVQNLLKMVIFCIEFQLLFMDLSKLF